MYVYLGASPQDREPSAIRPLTDHSLKTTGSGHSDLEVVMEVMCCIMCVCTHVYPVSTSRFRISSTRLAPLIS